jgi:hypothetical protein
MIPIFVFLICEINFIYFREEFLFRAWRRASMETGKANLSALITRDKKIGLESVGGIKSL